MRKSLKRGKERKPNMKVKRVNYSLGIVLLCAFVGSTAFAQKQTAAEVLPKPEQAFSDELDSAIIRRYGKEKHAGAILGRQIYTDY